MSKLVDWIYLIEGFLIKEISFIMDGIIWDSKKAFLFYKGRGIALFDLS